MECHVGPGDHHGALVAVMCLAALASLGCLLLLAVVIAQEAGPQLVTLGEGKRGEDGGWRVGVGSGGWRRVREY